MITIPRTGWVDAMVDAGVPRHFAGEFAELYDAEESGLLQANGERQYRCSTTIDETLRHMLRTSGLPEPTG